MADMAFLTKNLKVTVLLTAAPQFSMACTVKIRWLKMSKSRSPISPAAQHCRKAFGFLKDHAFITLLKSLFIFEKQSNSNRERGKGEEMREVERELVASSIAGSFLKWPQRQGLVQAKPRSLELQLGLSHGWQGPKHSGHYPLLSQAH